MSNFVAGEIDFFSFKSNNFICCPSAIWFVNTAYTKRTILGLYKSLFDWQLLRLDYASAVRNKAPMFPGFSGASPLKSMGCLTILNQITAFCFGYSQNTFSSISIRQF
jgi:hypothetical protein